MVKISRYQDLIVMFFQSFSSSLAIITSTLASLVCSLTIVTAPSLAQDLSNKTIQGTTGGNNNSGDCGYIADQPNYVINLNEQTYSLNVILEANNGKPSLLVLGPGNNDRFCVLGEPTSGKLAKMGGVWAPGKYLIYVGDAPGNKNPFTLKVVNKK